MRQAFKLWCGDPNNLVLFPAYCVAGTNGNTVLSGKRHVEVRAVGGHAAAASATSLRHPWVCGRSLMTVPLSTSSARWGDSHVVSAVPRGAI